MRPIIHTEPTEHPEEHFQNTVLRPILKQQHALLVSTFRHSFPSLEEQAVANRSALLRQKIQKDVVLSATLTGIVLGQMTEEELAIYWNQRAVLAKRLRSMLIERLVDAYQRL